jgi:light-regulated signal transduction histidine kinase (bacteriophytochrome)
VRRALSNLRGAIDDSGAIVTCDPLPVAPSDEVQLAQVFQNLIGNALKFRSQSAPRIHVAVDEKAAQWEIAVRDNGIGIEPQYFERIFVIFQRLNPREQYPGTGIGLAIAKKIIERQGGRIWVESQAGQGTTVSFTIPVLTVRQRRAST